MISTDEAVMGHLTTFVSRANADTIHCAAQTNSVGSCVAGSPCHVRERSRQRGLLARANALEGFELRALHN